MRVVLAPDKFKGSLLAREVAAHLGAGIRRVAPDVEVAQVPIADGGDGTVDAALVAGYERIPVRATGPTGGVVDTAFALQEGTAVAELADVCGLGRLPQGRPAPLRAGTRGLGEVVSAALDHGAHTVVLGVGGSASTDGGAGVLQALGARLTDTTGDEVGPGGRGLAALDAVDLSGLDPRLHRTRVVVAVDVDNPLLGPRGAAAMYGPQKGATSDDVSALDATLRRFADAVDGALGVSPAASARDRAGAGAAGGVGYGAMAVLGAVSRPGIDLVLDLVGFGTHLREASLVVTGEGALDEQTLHGKAPAGVAAAARAAGVPVVAVCGRLALTEKRLTTAGIDRVYALADLEPDLHRCLSEAGPLLERLGARLAEDWLAGRRDAHPGPASRPHATRPST